MKPRVNKTLTIPHPDRAIATPTYEPVAPELDAPYKVLIHIPTPIRVWWRWHGECACGRGCARKRQLTTRRGDLGVGDRPKDVHREHTLTSGEIPLTERLV